MYFLTDNKNKVILGWSAKSACTHVKHIFCHYCGITIPKGKTVHAVCGYHGLPKNYSSHHQKYTIVIFVRNPFKRLVSGFLNKPQLIHIPPQEKTFERLTKMLLNGRWNKLDPGGKGHHFRPHLSEKYIDHLKPDYVFDIERIDYNKLDELFRRTLPEELKIFRGHAGHCTNYHDDQRGPNPWKIPHRNLPNPRPPYQMFYDDELKKKVRIIYKKDFAFFEKHGIHFDVHNSELIGFGKAISNTPGSARLLAATPGSWENVYEKFCRRHSSLPNNESTQVKNFLILLCSNNVAPPKLITYQNNDKDAYVIKWMKCIVYLYLDGSSNVILYCDDDYQCEKHYDSVNETISFLQQQQQLN